jgi:hypothetical protein
MLIKDRKAFQRARQTSEIAVALKSFVDSQDLTTETLPEYLDVARRQHAFG